MAWPMAGPPRRQNVEAVWLSLEPRAAGTRQDGGFDNHSGATEFLWGILSDCCRAQQGIDGRFVVFMKTNQSWPRIINLVLKKNSYVASRLQRGVNRKSTAKPRETRSENRMRLMEINRMAEIKGRSATPNKSRTPSRTGLSRVTQL